MYTMGEHEQRYTARQVREWLERRGGDRGAEIGAPGSTTALTVAGIVQAEFMRAAAEFPFDRPKTD